MLFKDSSEDSLNKNEKKDAVPVPKKLLKKGTKKSIPDKLVQWKAQVYPTPIHLIFK